MTYLSVWSQWFCQTLKLMCVQIAKCLYLCYNLILFIAAHLSHFLSHFPSPDWCSVVLSSIQAHRWRYAVWLTCRHFTSVLCTLLLFLCCFQVVYVSSRVKCIIRFFHACNVSRWIQCLAIRTCYCIAVYPPPLSTAGTGSFITLPLLSSQATQMDECRMQWDPCSDDSPTVGYL